MSDPNLCILAAEEIEQEQPARRGITQDQVASAAGMMRNNISRIEAAKHRPTLETLERIAKALKVSVAELIVPAR